VNGNPKKAAAATVEPRLRPEKSGSREALIEAQELASRKEELDRRNSIRSNRVAQFLQASYCITDQAFAFLIFKGERLTVSEFYPEIMVAVDKFYDDSEFDQEVCDAKKKLFKKHRIRYAFLKPGKRLADLETDLEV
jgi:hypothetical protein